MTAPRATLSVVVPTLDEAPSLPALLTSLRGEGAPEEVLVVDGGSADGTRALAREHGARVLRTERGRGAQLARGAAASVGELLLFLHADTRLAPDTLPALRRAFEDPGRIATGMQQSVEHPARFYRIVEAAADARVRRGWVYGDSGLCVRRAAYDAVGGFRDVELFEDLDLSRRLRRRGRVELAAGARLIVSARRWESEGRLRRTFVNWALTAAFLAGVPARRLVRYYPPRAAAPREAREAREDRGTDRAPGTRGARERLHTGT